MRDLSSPLVEASAAPAPARFACASRQKEALLFVQPREGLPAAGRLYSPVIYGRGTQNGNTIMWAVHTPPRPSRRDSSRPGNDARHNTEQSRAICLATGMAQERGDCIANQRVASTIPFLRLLYTRNAGDLNDDLLRAPMFAELRPLIRGD